MLNAAELNAVTAPEGKPRISLRSKLPERHRRGITTMSGKRWQATQVIRARRRLGLTAPENCHQLPTVFASDTGRTT
jgi:hypothetical protein